MSPTESSSTGTVALIIAQNRKKPQLIVAISDDEEIAILEESIHSGHESPLDKILDFRNEKGKEEEEFGDYVEQLLTQQFVPKEVQDHGIAWFKSKMKIEDFKQQEEEATQVIAEYAYQIFLDNTERREFILSGPKAKVLIKVYLVEDTRENQAA